MKNFNGSAGTLFLFFAFELAGAQSSICTVAAQACVNLPGPPGSSCYSGPSFWCTTCSTKTCRRAPPDAPDRTCPSCAGAAAGHPINLANGNTYIVQIGIFGGTGFHAPLGIGSCGVADCCHSSCFSRFSPLLKRAALANPALRMLRTGAPLFAARGLGMKTMQVPHGHQYVFSRSIPSSFLHSERRQQEWRPIQS